VKFVGSVVPLTLLSTAEDGDGAFTRVVLSCDDGAVGAVVTIDLNTLVHSCVVN
jgi:hypothetical protein